MKRHLFRGEIFSRESCTTSWPRRGFHPKKVGGNWWESWFFLDVKKKWLRMYDGDQLPFEEVYIIMHRFSRIFTQNETFSDTMSWPPWFLLSGVTASEDLLRQLAAERVKGLPVLHFDGSVYELLDLADGVAGDGEKWEMGTKLRTNIKSCWVGETWLRLWKKSICEFARNISSQTGHWWKFFGESSGEVNRTAPLLGQLAPHGTLWGGRMNTTPASNPNTAQQENMANHTQNRCKLNYSDSIFRTYSLWSCLWTTWNHQ